MRFFFTPPGRLARSQAARSRGRSAWALGNASDDTVTGHGAAPSTCGVEPGNSPPTRTAATDVASTSNGAWPDTIPARSRAGKGVLCPSIRAAAPRPTRPTTAPPPRSPRSPPAAFSAASCRATDRRSRVGSVSAAPGAPGWLGSRSAAGSTRRSSGTRSCGAGRGWSEPPNRACTRRRTCGRIDPQREQSHRPNIQGRAQEDVARLHVALDKVGEGARLVTHLRDDGKRWVWDQRFMGAGDDDAEAQQRAAVGLRAERPQRT